MYFEIFSTQGNLIIRGKKYIGTLQFDHELNLAPTVTMVLPADWHSIISGREEIKIHLDDGKVFWGIIWNYSPIDKVNETITLDIRHVITEWQYRQISVNHAISDNGTNASKGKLNIVYKGDSTEHSDGNMETITASGFTISVAEGKTITPTQVIAKARATAWSTANGDRVPVTHFTVQKCETDDNDVEHCTSADLKSEGTYRVTFRTLKGTATSVDVSVEEKYVPEYGTLPDADVADKLLDIYNDTNFAYPGWQIEWRNGAENRYIDYVYSKQNKLDALTETVELTEDLWWRVGFWNEKKVQIGTFGDEKPYIISKKPSGKTNIRMIQEPSIEPDLENVINVATVYSDKSDGGMSSLTLREVYMDKSLQNPNFPVVILHSNVNNERDYRMYIDQYPKLAPNNEVEYAILDVEGIALESGVLIEGSYSFNDLSPFEIDGRTVTDEKRIKAAKTVYASTIKKLIQSRRSFDFKLSTEHLPSDLLAGDKVRLVYDNSIWEQMPCSNRWKKIMKEDDWFYITHITYNIDEYGNEWNELTLTKWLKIERETANTQG